MDAPGARMPPRSPSSRWSCAGDRGRRRRRARGRRRPRCAPPRFVLLAGRGTSDQRLYANSLEVGPRTAAAGSSHRPPSPRTGRARTCADVLVVAVSRVRRVTLVDRRDGKAGRLDRRPGRATRRTRFTATDQHVAQVGRARYAVKVDGETSPHGSPIRPDRYFAYMRRVVAGPPAREQDEPRGAQGEDVCDRARTRRRRPRSPGARPAAARRSRRPSVRPVVHAVPPDGIDH